MGSLQGQPVRVDAIVMPHYNTKNWYLLGISEMSKNTSITLGPHFEQFIDKQLKEGRFSSTSEVIRAALRLLEEEETRLSTLRKLLEEGEQSGMSDYSLTGLVDELNNDIH